MLPYPPSMKTHHFALVALIGALAIANGTAQSRTVQVGFCTPLANIEAAKAAGFDYVELGTSEIAGPLPKMTIVVPSCCWRANARLT